MTQAVAATVSPQEQIMGFIMSIVQGRCVVAAAELELADVLAKGPLPVERSPGRQRRMFEDQTPRVDLGS